MTRELRQIWRALASAAVFLFLAAAPVFAQEGDASPADTPVGWVFRWLNFALVFGGIGYAIWKWGAPYFRQHAEEISNKIAEGVPRTRSGRRAAARNSGQAGRTGR